MAQTFTIKLDDKEQATVRRLAADANRPAADIVQHLIRSPLFMAAVALAIDPGSWRNMLTDETVPDPTQEMWSEISRALTGSAHASGSG